MKCRHCKQPLHITFLDLGFAPPSNAYLTKADLIKSEKYYPLKIKVCESCWLVQTEDYAAIDELFSPDYAYFSSTSFSWLKHAKEYAVKIIDELGLTSKSLVIEVASNDGYLLKNFLDNKIPCLGIEPTNSTAMAAEELGIPVLKEFFNEALGRRLTLEGRSADLIIGNNVFAHVPDINDFTLGLKAALKQGGTITLEFPHLQRLIEYTQFDTVYHEHFSYLSLYTVQQILMQADLRIWNVEELSTHGGSLRIFACHAKDKRETLPSVDALLEQELIFGLKKLTTYQNFQTKAEKIKNDLLNFLLEQKRLGKTIAAYGAAAKGNTLLNFAGVKPDLLPVVYDAAPAKQGKFMPGSHIPISPPEDLAKNIPNWLLILPWNIKAEVTAQNLKYKELGMKFVTVVPSIHQS